MDLAKQGSDALSAGKYGEAVNLYTEALKQNPNAVKYYIDRSTAYGRLKPPNLKAALADSEKAVILAHKRGSRDLIAKSQFRRAVTLFNAERYGDASFLFKIVKKLDEKDKQVPVYETRIQNKAKNLGNEDEKMKVTVRELPDDVVDTSSRDEQTHPKENLATPAKSEPPKAPTQTPADKIKHEWYQSAEFVTLTLLARGVPKDKTTVDITERSLNLSFPTLTGATFDFSLDPLYASIDPSQSTYNIMPAKVDIKLKKQIPGIKWHNLEGTLDSADNADSKTASVPHAVLMSNPKPTGPAYPTSSKSGPKDWDKVAKELTKKPAADGKAEDTYDDLEEGDDVNKFFKQLYAGSDPDTQRAMMKSYQESNGTVLSTNWNEVKKAKVETTPPDGMEAREWTK
jgi:suppressor of G2 allele of SKP1